jgi:hypothetical protein
MKHSKLITSLLLASLLASFVPTAQAQTATRATPCSATTPNNAICVVWNPVTTATDGSTITGVQYRIEQRTGSAGTWATLTATIVNPQFLVQNLAPGEYQFRVFASCATCTAESGPSNIGTGTATAPPKVPTAPVITIAVVISHDSVPVFRVSAAGNSIGSTLFGLIPTGRPCGAKVATWRGTAIHRVTVQTSEVWPRGTSTANLAAPCAAQS